MAHLKFNTLQRFLRWLPAAVLAVTLCAAVAAAQSKDIRDLGLGKFLVASRDLGEPAFAESVIVLVQYDRTGTVGLAINRITKIPISEALSELASAKNHEDPVFVGGPVEAEAVRALVRSRLAPDLAQHIFGDLYMVWQRRALERELMAKRSPAVFRVYLGYCGWARGQLESEVRAGGWHIFDAATVGKQNVFDADPDGMWEKLIAKTERQLARR